MNSTYYTICCRSLLALLVVGMFSIPLHAEDEASIPKNGLNEKVSGQEMFLTISGKITNEDGDPMVGATVVAKETSQGTLTDNEGNFSLDVGDEARTLVVSYIGFQTQEISINGRTSINVVLSESISSLNEVVVTGYTTQKKANLTGAVTAVNAEAFENRPLTSAAVAMQGAAPGVFINQNSGQPGNDNVLIRIRGVGTLNNANPLVLVDGIEAPIDNRNPMI